MESATLIITAIQRDRNNLARDRLTPRLIVLTHEQHKALIIAQYNALIDHKTICGIRFVLVDRWPHENHVLDRVLMQEFFDHRGAYDLAPPSLDSA